MDWIETPESSNIARMAYNNATQVLKIEFKNGGTYDYYDVPENIFEAMRTASSKGQYLVTQIKGNYRYAKA